MSSRVHTQGDSERAPADVVASVAALRRQGRHALLHEGGRCSGESRRCVVSLSACVPVVLVLVCVYTQVISERAPDSCPILRTVLFTHLGIRCQKQIARYQIVSKIILRYQIYLLKVDPYHLITKQCLCTGLSRD